MMSLVVNISCTKYSSVNKRKNNATQFLLSVNERLEGDGGKNRNRREALFCRTNSSLPKTALAFRLCYLSCAIDYNTYLYTVHRIEKLS